MDTVESVISIEGAGVLRLAKKGGTAGDKSLVPVYYIRGRGVFLLCEEVCVKMEEWKVSNKNKLLILHMKKGVGLHDAG